MRISDWSSDVCSSDLLAFPLALASMLAAPALADVKDGVDAWQAGNYQAAVAEWRPLAIAGDADAQFNLGQAYKPGRGVPTDLTQAEAWYRRAAKQGPLQAEDNRTEERRVGKRGGS